MPVLLEVKENALVAYISGEVDHHTAKSIRSEIDSEIERINPEKVILDFSAVTFMDSSGIGLVMGRYKIMQTLGGTVAIQNPPEHIKKVMRLAGLDKIANIINTKVGSWKWRYLMKWKLLFQANQQTKALQE